MDRAPFVFVYMVIFYAFWLLNLFYEVPLSFPSHLRPLALAPYPAVPPDCSPQQRSSTQRWQRHLRLYSAFTPNPFHHLHVCTAFTPHLLHHMHLCTASTPLVFSYGSASLSHEVHHPFFPLKYHHRCCEVLPVVCIRGACAARAVLD